MKMTAEERKTIVLYQIGQTDVEPLIEPARELLDALEKLIEQ